MKGIGASKGSMKTSAIIVLIVAIAAGAGWYFWTAPAAPSEEIESPTGKYMGIESYVKNNISELSPSKEQVGGTFYVTDLSITSPTSGVVSYEDGHNAYVADFTYRTDPETYRPEVTTFVIRQ